VTETRTTTSYAVLGLLALRSWTTYELAKQVRRSLHWFWPRAERKLYDEPKVLLRQDLATASPEATGKRTRTVYTITEAGRTALRRWLDEPPAPRSTEFEGMVKVFFADAGDLAQLRSTLRRMTDEAQEHLAELAEMARTHPLPFPQRAHLSALGLRLEVDLERAIQNWARWAQAQTESWPSTIDPGDWDATAELHRIAESAVAPAPR
jgi:DNA-binding PadR family transcriptional regulator